jgi:malonyl-CoA O-methyltransferase
VKWLWNRNKKAETLSPLDGYNLWAATYQHESNPIKNLSDKLVEQLLPDLKDKSFLDAGCGTGKFCGLAQQRNAAQITGIDLSPAMVEVARQLNTKIEFQCGDLSSISIKENQYDIIVCALVLGHLEFLSPCLDNLLKALRPDGTLIITDFHPVLTLLKAKRTFKDLHSGKSFEVIHHLHLFQEYFNYFKKYQLIVEELQESVFNNTPVVFAIRVKKIM